MGIDWTTEPYARLYKRETDDDMALSWEARAIWHEFLKRCDQVGAIETKRGSRGLAAHVRIPVEVVERALPELLEDGRIVARAQAGFVGFVAPNYLDANFSARADRARAAESRARRRHFALGTESGSHGASGHENADSIGSHGASDSSVDNDFESGQHGAGTQSHDVTASHSESQPVTQIRSDQIRSDQQSARGRARGGFSVMSEDWQPREREVAIAASLGLDVDVEAKEFREWWIGDGRSKKDWDSLFSSRLRTVGKRKATASPGASEIRNLEQLDVQSSGGSGGH